MQHVTSRNRLTVLCDSSFPEAERRSLYRGQGSSGFTNTEQVNAATDLQQETSQTPFQRRFFSFSSFPKHPLAFYSSIISLVPIKAGTEIVKLIFQKLYLHSLTGMEESFTVKQSMLKPENYRFSPRILNRGKKESCFLLENQLCMPRPGDDQHSFYAETCHQADRGTHP